MLWTTPSFPQLRQVCHSSAKGRLWDDPALKPLRDKFLERWGDELAKPLERDLGVSLSSLARLLQGQVTFALTRATWQDGEAQPLGFLFLLDARDQAPLLKTNLSALRTKWLASGRRCKTERVRGLEFTVFPATTNEMPQSVTKLLWRPPVFPQLLGGDNVRQAPVAESTTMDNLLDTLRGILTDSHVLVVGQVDTCLLIGNSVGEVEKAVIRLTGGARPALADVPGYQTGLPRQACSAPCYGWVNVKEIVRALVRKSSESRSNLPADPLEGPPVDKLMAVLGLDGCKSLSFNLRDSAEGSTVHLFLSVPDAARRGLFRLLACPARDAAPPPFVPADAAGFFRWRIDGTRTWLALEKLLNDLSPQSLSGLNLVLNTADARARLDDPGFSLKQTLLASLGDDIIYYERGPRGKNSSPRQPSPSIVLLGSPNPEMLAVALERLFVIFPQGDAIKEREFLGRTIFSVVAPALPLFPAASSRSTPSRTIYWAASGSYVALATDAALLEEHLRGSAPTARALRDIPGLLDAAQNVGGLRTGLLAYANDATSMRLTFEAARLNPTASTNGIGPSLFPGLPGLSGPEETLTGWMDFSLLPAFDKVAHYFSYSLFSVSADTEGLTLRTFLPRPAALRRGDMP